MAPRARPRRAATGWVLAVDFGTSSTEAAVRSADGRVDMVKFDTSSDTMSSAVAFPDGRPRTGQAALNCRRSSPGTFVASPKAWLGRGPVPVAAEDAAPGATPEPVSPVTGPGLWAPPAEGQVLAGRYELLGTATYLAPERACGKQVDGRADLYSTGCVLFEMLTGQPLFPGDDALVILKQHLEATPRPRPSPDPTCRPPWTPSWPEPWPRTPPTATRPPPISPPPSPRSPGEIGRRWLLRPSQAAQAPVVCRLIVGRSSVADGAQQPVGRDDEQDVARVGQVLAGRYELRALIGSGGMSEVYLAHDRHIGGDDADVAVKVLSAKLARDPTFLARFRDEARTTFRLDHHNIVRVTDTNATDDRPGPRFLVMSYVKGQTLADALPADGLPLAQAVRIVCDVLAALGYAHRRGVVHRDIKPGNVMLTDGGQAKVVDFGIARVMEATSYSTTLMGTAGYVAPERLRGQQVDGRADLYSTGCLLFEVLTGRRPFDGDDYLAVISQHLYAEAPKPTAVRPDLPSAVDAVVANALAKAPDDRYQSAEEFADALRGLVGERPGPAQQRPSPPSEPPTSPPSFAPAVHDGHTVRAPQPVVSPASETVQAVASSSVKVPGGPGSVMPSVAAPAEPVARSKPPQRALAHYPPVPASQPVADQPEPEVLRRAPGPVERLGRLAGLVDYQARRPSTVEEVAGVCQEVAGLRLGDVRRLVRLSGIDWRVLGFESSHRQALLLADRVVGTGPYNEVREATTWERCDLRDWLNLDFAGSLGVPLTSRVARTRLRNENNPVWDTAGGNDTTDRFFLLSTQEAADWLAGQKSIDWRKYRTKGWSASDGLIAKNEDGQSAWWWLRSPGGYPDYAAVVHDDGVLRDAGVVSGSSGGVRPAFWLSLES